MKDDVRPLKEDGADMTKTPMTMILALRSAMDVMLERARSNLGPTLIEWSRIARVRIRLQMIPANTVPPTMRNAFRWAIRSSV